MDCVRFMVNGVQHAVGDEVTSDTTLLEFLRTRLELRGTKSMCLEGGCGACVVSVVDSPGSRPKAVNSCLVSITSCQDWQITTIENVGNRLKGYHPLQKTLADTNGSQCGYCSPGWIMSMYSLLDSEPTMLEIERSLSSNMCRCTGYRSILEAFRKFGRDAPDQVNVPDIEELHLCPKVDDRCLDDCDQREWCLVSKDSLDDSVLSLQLKDGRRWFGASTVGDVFKILREQGKDSYMLVAGNTGKGVIPIIEYPRILIDISRVSELKGYLIDQNLIVGAATTLTRLIEIFNEVSVAENFKYLKILNDHLRLVAHVAVRNLGTIGGNLMLKHKNNSFASDIFLLLLTINAQVTIALAPGVIKVVALENFLVENMTGKLILNIIIPPLCDGNRLVTYKIAARSQNAHAIVNAAFLFKYDTSDNVLKSCRIAYGGLAPKFNLARYTERYLIGKNLFCNDTMQTALYSLSNELIVTDNPPEPSTTYRKQLALGLFYKALLSLCPENILHPYYRSGAGKIHESRPVSRGSQIFETDPNLWPLNQPIQKLDALIQCAGESKYVQDLPSLPRQVFAAFVLSTVALGTIDSIDAREALKQPGVVAFYTAKDIPGVNSFTSNKLPFTLGNEEILCSGNVVHFNQPIGIVAADTSYIANRAALMVKVNYRNVKKPIVDVRLNKNDPNKIELYRSIDATNVGNNVAKIIKGDQTIFGQNYFCLETMNCIARPNEDGLSLRPSTHYVNADHLLTAECLNIAESRIEIKSYRLGGSFGIKLSRQTQITTACSIVAYKLNRPCRFIVPLRTQSRAIGKRMPSSTNFEVGVNAEGVIQYMNYEVFNDNGWKTNELIIFVTSENYYNCYKKDKWNFQCFNVVTDTPSNTWMRAPGTAEVISATEIIMDRIAYELGLDPLTVRMNNLDTENYNDIAQMIDTLKNDSNYSERRSVVDTFNAKNRWTKRGLRFALMKWSATVAFTMNTMLSVYHGDGSVAITHSGVDLGQGLHTKAVQVCAYFLKIPLNKIHIKASNTMSNPNSSYTAASVTSQNVALGVTRCCEILLERLEPIKAQMHNPTWEQLIAEAYKLGVNLQTNSYVSPDDIVPYNVFGVALAELEIDILTGQWEILRVDLTQDVGRSVSPNIDIGQVEGAFIMGVGYWTSEQLVYNTTTGEVLSDRTWNYHVPLGTDIPQDFRVYLRKRSYSKDLILGSKALGEPPLCLGVVVPLAMREAIVSARLDAGIHTTEWFQIDGPYTVEKINLSCGTKLEDMKFY